MKLAKWLACVSAISALLMVSISADAARIKCWTNDEGVRECGNSVPPKYAQKGHQEVSKSGLTVNSQGAAVSQQERDRRAAKKQAEKIAKVEAERVARIEKRRKRKQAIKDRVLLDTFVSEEDMWLAHSRKDAAINSRIDHRQTHIKKLEVTLGKHQKSAANQERSGEKVSQKTLDSLAHVQQQLDASEQFISYNHDTIDRLELEYQLELGRFRHLKSGAGTGSPLQQ